MNNSLNRREMLVLVATGAAGAACGAPAHGVEGRGEEQDIVAHHDAGLETTMAAQVTAASSPAYGAIPSATGLFSAHAASGFIEAAVAAYLHPQSRFQGKSFVVDRIRLAAQFLHRVQHPDGRIDLLETNFDSTPDTGFVLHGMCTAACLAKRHQQGELLALLAPFIQKAAEALTVGGIHTPNHRWVVCSALAQANEIFPDPRYVRRIDQWLAEGIDIDDDGQYTERSTSVYDTICDRAFIVLAVKLQRPELLDPVRKNLRSLMYLLHPEDEVVTEISRRQDRDQRRTARDYWFPLRYLAVKDQDGQFLEIANHFTPDAASLAAWMEYPEMQGPLPAAVAPPSDFEKEMPALGIVRYRRGTISATILNENPTFFTLRNGPAVIESVRFASAFFGKGQLASQKYSRSGTEWVLEQDLEAPYYQPLDPPQKVTPANWAALRALRRTSQVCHLHQRATIAETPTGFRLRMQSAGTEGVPTALEIRLREGGELAGCEPAGTGAAFLTSGFATYAAGGHRIRFGPALHQHRYTQIRGALPKSPGTSVYLTGFTPFDHTVEFECS